LSLLNGWFSTMSFKCQWSWLSLLLPYLMLENAIEILRWHMFLYNIWFLGKFLILFIYTHCWEAIDEASKWVVIVAGQKLINSNLL
jgi:hypothetical protein